MDSYSSRRLWKAAVALPVVLLLAVACASEASRTGGSVDGSSVAREPADADGAEPFSAPDFTLATVNGESFKLSESSGQVRLIDFWATWCAPCREEIPMLNELQATYGDRGFRI